MIKLTRTPSVWTLCSHPRKKYLAFWAPWPVLIANVQFSKSMMSSPYHVTQQCRSVMSRLPMRFGTEVAEKLLSRCTVPGTTQTVFIEAVRMVYIRISSLLKALFGVSGYFSGWKPTIFHSVTNGACALFTGTEPGGAGWGHGSPHGWFFSEIPLDNLWIWA